MHSTALYPFIDPQIDFVLGDPFSRLWGLKSTYTGEDYGSIKI